MSVETFFSTMKLYLTGEITAQEALRDLGPSPSGMEAFAFYRILTERNAFKIMRDIFPTLPAIVERHRSGAWAELVRDFVRAHPARHRDPNQFGAPFCAYLQVRRERDPNEPALFEELADFHWIQFSASSAEEPAATDDGFDRTLFVRLYQNPIPTIVERVLADPHAELPAAQPMTVVVYRHRRTGVLRLLYPRPAAWAVLARRQGLKLPGPLRALDDALVARAEQGLIEQGVLLPASTIPEIGTNP